MAATPEIKNSSNKLSTHGSGINKRLLTPCRRIGLSRKIRTPSCNSTILKTSANGKRITDNYTSRTPVNTEKTERICKEGIKVNFDHLSPLSALKEKRNDNLVSSTLSVKRSIRKSLAPNFSENSICENNTILEGIEHDMIAGTPLNSEGEVKVEQTSIIAEVSMKSNSLVNEECGMWNLCKKTKLNDGMKNDYDDSFQNSPKLKKNKSSEKANNHKNHKKSISEDVREHFRECTVSVSKLSNDDINNSNNHNLRRITISEEISDDEPIGKVKHKKMLIMSDDEDDFCIVPKKCNKPITEDDLSNIRSQVLECNSHIDSIKKVTSLPTAIHVPNTNDHQNTNITDSFDEEFVGRNEKAMVISSDDSDFCMIPKKLKIPVSKDGSKINIKSQRVKSNIPKVSTEEDANLPIIFIHFSDEDDAFTSTPDQDKAEKKNLMDKVKTLAAQVQEKRMKLEDLKQASVYKTKHKIDELMKLVGKWKEGCVLGLNGLLTQLQSRGPINMPMLLINLHMSNEVVTKLCLNVSDN